MKVKIMFCDTETGGVDRERNPLLTAAFVMTEFDTTDKTIEVLNKDVFHIRPFNHQYIEPKALEINKLEMEDIMKFSHPKEVYADMQQFFGNFVDKYNKKDKLRFAGYNARFDYDFLYKFFQNNNDNYLNSFFSTPPIDVMMLAAATMIEYRDNLPNFKLETVAKALHINIEEEEVFHDAMADIKITLKIFSKLMDFITII